LGCHPAKPQDIFSKLQDKPLEFVIIHSSHPPSSFKPIDRLVDLQRPLQVYIVLTLEKSFHFIKEFNGHIQKAIFRAPFTLRMP
jgi:hypothetical protein